MWVGENREKTGKTGIWRKIKKLTYPLRLLNLVEKKKNVICENVYWGGTLSLSFSIWQFRQFSFKGKKVKKSR